MMQFKNVKILFLKQTELVRVPDLKIKSLHHYHATVRNFIFDLQSHINFGFLVNTFCFITSLIDILCVSSSESRTSFAYAFIIRLTDDDYQDKNPT